MFHAIIIITVCDILCSFSGFTHAVSRHQSLRKRSHGLESSHRLFHRLEIARSFDAEEYPKPVPHGRASRKHIPGSRGLFSGFGGLFKGAADVVGKLAVSAIKTGHQFILPPLKGIESLTVKSTRAIGLNNNLLNSIASSVKSAWNHAKAFKFPGKNIVALVFPNRIVTIADKLTNDFMYIATRTKDAVKATVAYYLYVTLKVIFSATTVAIKTLGYGCIPMDKTTVSVNAGLIDTIEISGGSICGLGTLEPKNNVTISRDDGKFMVITMPWVFWNLHIKIHSMDASGYFGTMIKDQPIETTIAEVACQGTVTFQKGTFLKFMTLHLEMVDINGINVKLAGAMEEGGTVARLVNSLAGSLGGVIQTRVNAKLVEMEKGISDFLLGNVRR